MQVLVLNCGSSSIKADVLDPDSGARARYARVERVGTATCAIRVGDGAEQALDGATHETALAVLLPRMLEGLTVGAVGHRVVHGGERFTAPTRIDDALLSEFEALSALAPLHNPHNIAGIRAARAALPGVAHVAVFDTAFHATLPRRARTYAIPTALAAEHGIRRYGFHGPSHRWVAERAAEFMGEDLRQLRIVTCHLGNGASAAAVEYGRSVETSMGMTPLEGLVMGTRSGDLDPGVVVELARRGIDPATLDHTLNYESGLAGLSGVGNDLRDIEARAAEGDDACRLAIIVFAHRLRKYIGAYAAVMGGADAVVFTGGIGENSAEMRHRVAQRLEFLGARLDEDRNRAARVSLEKWCAEISAPHGRTRLLVVKTDEAHAIGRDAARIAREADVVEGVLRIPVAISARHIHLDRRSIDALFGANYELTPRSPLSQPGQYASEERLTLIGPKGEIPDVRVLGPERAETQVEIARTDEFKLGVDAPVRGSGDLASTPGITLQGPKGRITLDHGLICARRHIHMTPADAKRFGVEHGDVVEVALDTEGRDLVFGDVLVRVSPHYKLEMHVDTDEGNAAGLGRGAEGVLVHTEGAVRLLRRKVAFDA